MKQIKDLFHWYESTIAFMTHKNLNLIPLDSIAFIGQTGQIYVQGRLLGVSTEEFNTLKTSIQEIQNFFGEDNSIIEKMNFIIEFFEQFNDDGGLQAVLDKLQSTVDSLKQTIDNHINDTENPHKVTKAQVGLGDVEDGATKDAPITEDELKSILV